MIHPVKYSVEGGSFNTDDLADTEGACDAIIICSINFPEGCRSQQFCGLDGRTQEPVSPHEFFSTWVMMAAHLNELLPLDDGRRKLSHFVFEAHRAAILGARLVVLETDKVNQATEILTPVFNRMTDEERVQFALNLRRTFCTICGRMLKGKETFCECLLEE